ncbi:MAG TPA: class I SAM-dependent methyltransferase [Gemmatimonadaceae bacterium]|nr:class I SAM-dependent methyltransferase [Gemmatimonadaceae bacterium]
MNKEVLLDSRVESLLDRLYEQNSAQGATMETYFSESAEPSVRVESSKPESRSVCRRYSSPRRSATTRPRERSGNTPLVIATEYEAEKASIARSHFAAAGLSHFVDLREGDLRETLIDLQGPIDFALIDIWTPMSRPALELIAPHLGTGAVVICDNTQQFRDAYNEYFAFVHDPRNGLRTTTLPFEGGLEFTVKVL